VPVAIGVYYKENFDYSVGEIGIVIFFAGFGSIIGNVIGGKLSDKIDKKAVVSIAAVIVAIGRTCKYCSCFYGSLLSA